MRKLDFLNFKQRPYTNVTARRGYKWSDLRIGEIIALTDAGKDTDITAAVRQVTVKRFEDIKPEELKREHDSSCTTRKGLLRAMREAYPDFDPMEAVTLITYVIPKYKQNKGVNGGAIR